MRRSEGEAADCNGNGTGTDTIELQYRLPLQSKRLLRIGKEVDRLGGDEGATLQPDEPVEYDRNELAEDIEYLAQFPQAEVASEIGMSERRWRDIVKGASQPRGRTAERIRPLAAQRRLDRA